MDERTFNAAVAWLNGRRDFSEGIALLRQAGFKPGVVAKLARDGVSGPVAMERLVFQMRELLKAIGRPLKVEDTDAELHVFEGTEAPADHNETQQLGVLRTAQELEAGTVTMEATPARLIRQYSQAYKQRDKAMRMMASAGETNDTAVMEQRHQLSDEIERLTSLMERLYPLFERYQSGADITDEEVSAAIEGKPSRQTDSPSEKSASQESGAGHTMEGETRDELVRLRKNAQVRLLRTQNKLQYQSEKVADTPNPMPEGPKRMQLETRAAQLEQEIHDYDLAIARFG